MPGSHGLGRIVRGTDVSLIPYVNAGILWSSGVPRTSLAANGQFHLTLKNPTNSQKRLFLEEFAFYSSGSMDFDFWLNPTTNLPTTNLTIFNHVIGSSAYNGLMEIKGGSTLTPFSGGTHIPYVLGAGIGTSYNIHNPLVLLPGTMLGMQTTSSANIEIALSMTWHEDPAS